MEEAMLNKDFNGYWLDMNQVQKGDERFEK